MSLRRSILLSGSAVMTLTFGAKLANAQIAVFDPALTLKNAAIAALRELLRDTLNDEADRLHKMAKRLSARPSPPRSSTTFPDTAARTSQPTWPMAGQAHPLAPWATDGPGRVKTKATMAATARAARATALNEGRGTCRRGRAGNRTRGTRRRRARRCSGCGGRGPNMRVPDGCELSAKLSGAAADSTDGGPTGR